MKHFVVGSVVLVCLFVALVFSPSAHAYCRTTTGGLAVFENNRECKPSGTNCCTIGKPVWWRNACIGFSMHTQPTTKRDISAPLASRTIAQAFNIWTSASCPAGEDSSRVSIDVRQLPPAECTEIKTGQTTKNQNIIMFRDAAWNHRDPDRVLAVTSVHFNTQTGEIRGADLEFNTLNHDMQCQRPTGVNDPSVASCFDAPPPPNSYDFASIVTHELGHFLGLAHSNDPDATMAAQYAADGKNYTLRSLTADDIAGICHAYPANRMRRTGDNGDEEVPQGPCDPTPKNGFTSECDEGGCACSLVPTRHDAAAAATALGLALVFVTRRSRRTRQP